jgi:hypothetical protein
VQNYREVKVFSAWRRKQFVLLRDCCKYLNHSNPQQSNTVASLRTNYKGFPTFFPLHRLKFLWTSVIMLSRPLLQAAAFLITLPSAAHAQLFTVNCAPLTVQRGDPIVTPGVISPHVHIVVGGTAFQQSLSNDAARRAKATTCDKILDNSNYWQPQLYHQRRDGQFEIVKMQGIVCA